MESGAYRLQLFGFPQLVVAGAEALSVSRRGRGILCYLALARDRKASRERLCNMFWQDRGTPQARASLRQTLLELRSALPPGAPDLIKADRQYVALDARCIVTDLEAAENAASPTALLDMIGRIGAEPLIEMQPLGAAFEEWRLAARPLTEARLRAAILSQMDAAEAGEDHAAVIALADVWALRDPLDELIASRAVAAEVRSNARAAAERRYRVLARLMESELGVKPDPQRFGLLTETSRESVKLRAADSSPDPVSAAPLRTVSRPNLWNRPRRYAAAAAGLAVLGSVLGLSMGVMRREPAPAGAMIAVLPFTAPNAGEPDAIFAAGLSEEIADSLAENGQVSVLGRVTAASLSTRPYLLDDADAQIGVTCALTGTLRYSADRSRIEIDATLRNIATGRTEWTRTVRLTSNDVSEAEHALADLVLRTVSEGAKSLPAAPARQNRPDAEAYTKIVLARRHILSREGDRLIEARELARQAAERAPQWAEAHAVRSIAASLMQNYTDMPEAPLQAEARAAAEKAVALDKRLPAAHEALSLALELEEPAKAMAAAREAVRLRPGNAEYRRRLAWLLKADGQTRAAVSELEAAVKIDPLWHLAYIDLGMSLAQMNAPDKLIAWQGRFAALKPPAKEGDLVFANMLLDTERAGEAAPVAARLVGTHPDLTYAALTWIDASLALFATQEIPPELFELNTLPSVVALARGETGDLIAAAAQDQASAWSDPEGAVILGYALLQRRQAARLREWHAARYRSPQEQLRAPPQNLVLGRHPDLYPAFAFAAVGDAAWSNGLRRKIEADIARLEQLGLAKSRTGLTIAALAAIGGDKEVAIDRLESAMSAQWSAVCHGPIWIGADPLFRSLEGNPRFAALQQRCRQRLDRQRAKAGLGPIKAL